MFLASGSDDSSIIVWKSGDLTVDTPWSAERILRGHSKEVNDVSWHPSGKFLATASIDGTVLIFSMMSFTIW